jgi:hypothetical protein
VFVPILVYVYLNTRIRRRVRVLAMAIVRTMVPNGTMVHTCTYSSTVGTTIGPQTMRPLCTWNVNLFFRLRRALRQPRVARLIGK